MLDHLTPSHMKRERRTSRSMLPSYPRISGARKFAYSLLACARSASFLTPPHSRSVREAGYECHLGFRLSLSAYLRAWMRFAMPATTKAARAVVDPNGGFVV